MLGLVPGRKRENRYHLAGWVLFLLCAALFLFSAVRDGDGILALASLVFLLGCVLFLIPLVSPHAKTGKVENGGDESQPGQDK